LVPPRTSPTPADVASAPVAVMTSRPQVLANHGSIRQQGQLDCKHSPVTHDRRRRRLSQDRDHLNFGFVDGVHRLMVEGRDACRVVVRRSSHARSVNAVVRGQESAMKSAIVNHSVVINEHKVSVSLEEQSWKELRQIASDSDMTLSELVEAIDEEHGSADLPSALRMFVLNFLRAKQRKRHGEIGYDMNSWARFSSRAT
jgi:predicted DNA-binding ribbon-helix-helix protein